MKESALSRFSEELIAYGKKKQELLKLCEGKFVIFKGSEFGGVYDSPASAYSAGIEKYGNDSFLIKPVLHEDRVEQFPALQLGVIHLNPNHRNFQWWNW